MIGQELDMTIELAWNEKLRYYLNVSMCFIQLSAHSAQFESKQFIQCKKGASSIRWKVFVKINDLNHHWHDTTSIPCFVTEFRIKVWKAFWESGVGNSINRIGSKIRLFVHWKVKTTGFTLLLRMCWNQSPYETHGKEKKIKKESAGVKNSIRLSFRMYCLVYLWKNITYG